MIDHLVAAILLVLPPAPQAQKPVAPKRPPPALNKSDAPSGSDQAKPGGAQGNPAAPPATGGPTGGTPAAPAPAGAQTLTPPGQVPPANPGAAPAANPNQGATPASGGASQGKARIAPIQDVGNEYVLTFDESGDTDALNLEQFVKICQETTGLNFTYSEETKTLLIKAKLRMFGQKRIPKTDFYSFFQIMMIINDFVCSKIGPDRLSVIVISGLQQGGQRGSTLRSEAVYVFSDDIDRYADQPATLVTTVIDLPNTDVRTLSNSMRTMFTDANTQQIIPVGNSNSLIITGFGSNVASIVKMLRFVDNAAANTGNIVPEFEVIPLEFASAEDISETLGDLLDASKRATQTRAQGQQQATGVTGALNTNQGEAKILTDPRTNSLLIMAMPDDMPRIKELVARLDVNVVEKERTYHIYMLENVAAEDLSKTLDDFIRDAGRIPTSTGGRTGQPARAGAPAQSSPTGGSSSARNDIVVVPDKTTNSLLIAANRTRYAEMYDLIRQLDKRQDQVLIETALVELTGTSNLDIGVELGGADLPGSGTGSFGVTSFGLSTFQDTNGDGIPDVRVPGAATGITAGILNGSNFNLPVLVSALQSRTDTNVLNVPSVLVNNTGSAKVVSTDEQPTTTITAIGGGGVGQTQENFKDYVKAGITLQISPTISASRYLRLKISLEVSTFLGTVSGAIPPPRVTRTIDTTVNVPDGDTMVIGGIITDNKGLSHSGVPFLGDLPVLGYLFRRQGDSASKTTLYFFVTPHIMRDRDFADLSEISYKKKLEAADTIGADRVRLVDPSFGQDKRGVDMRGLEVPLYRSPPRGEVRGSEVGIEPGKIQSMLKDQSKAQETPAPTPEKPAEKPPDPNASGEKPVPDPNTPPHTGAPTPGGAPPSNSTPGAGSTQGAGSTPGSGTTQGSTGEKP
jgi:general secretion pathway protein D